MMDAETRKQLMIQVERCVRPLRALGSRKDRMRRELFSHLTEVYEQESARSADDHQALQRALERFGQPEKVREDLQGSIPAVERFFHQPVLPDAAKRVFCRRPGETAKTLSIRQGFVGGVVYFGALLFIALLSVMGVNFRGDELSVVQIQKAVLLCAIASIGAVMVFAAQLLTYHKITAVINLGWRSTPSALCSLIATAGCSAGILFTLQLANLMNGLTIFPITSPGAVFLTVLFSGAVFETVTLLAVHERKRADQWESLEIEG